MPVSFRIFPRRGLVVVRYAGFATIDETVAASRAYVGDRHYAAGQKQLVDMTDITGFEKDYVRFMELQATKAERLAGAGVQSLVVYIAPTPISKEVSAMFMRSWADVDAVVPLVQDSEANALALLGQSETSIASLLPCVDGPALQ
ncbi:hypothetical protein [uncultured Tateyamaria sp.]|uniref:hypothetical protein n=1 Tax=uncultured Tateyamaria sp. TaxID=455651 RepID=UPI00262C7FF1|nr:hypothetical protein [uncultured Tateyamaria sp.]